MRKSFVSTIIAECERRDDIVIISGDAGLGVFDRFQADYPERFINLGIAEQNMAGFAAGLAMTGYKVFLYNIIPFLIYRCYEQVRNDICYQNLPIVLVGTGSGVTYAPAGISHYAVEDIGLARTLPNLTVLSPCDPAEAAAAARHSLEAEGPVYVRIAKQGEPIANHAAAIDLTAPQVIREGEQIAIVFHGSIAGEVLAACNDLAAVGIRPRLVSVPMLQPFNGQGLCVVLDGITAVISVEEHFADSGLGASLKGICAEQRPAWLLKTLGIDGEQLRQVQDTRGLRVLSGISASHIGKLVRELWGER